MLDSVEYGAAIFADGYDGCQYPINKVNLKLSKSLEHFSGHFSLYQAYPGPSARQVRTHAQKHYEKMV